MRTQIEKKMDNTTYTEACRKVEFWLPQPAKIRRYKFCMKLIGSVLELTKKV